MKKIKLIIIREYLVRVRKRSFIIMTFLGPILMAALMIVPIWLAQNADESASIGVVDESGIFLESFAQTENIQVSFLDESIAEAKANFGNSGFDVLLYIPKTELNVPEKGILYSNKQPSIIIKSFVEDNMKRQVESLKLSTSGIDENVLRSIKTSISLTTIKIQDDGTEKKTFTEVSMVLGLFSGILIYFFIFIFGSQVMRGVIEEKTNRIVEVIVSSVKPFQLLMGKIVGVALVGLTQFLLWIILTAALFMLFKMGFGDSLQLDSSAMMGNSAQAKEMMEGQMNMGAAKAFEMISSINFGVMIFSFLFYFLGGYLLYSALFAAIGAAVDNETDTQQFMLPVTIPLILAIVVAQMVIQNPEGPISFWFSIIPFTSPIIMMIRIPFGVPYEEILLSVVLLIAGFVGAVWLAGKIYRTGILMYGKKVTYGELWKWIRYKG
jgi:ABC-2 type transport system permease protein